MALPINIHDLVNGRTIESERLEFKTGFNEEAIIQSICAFANDINNWGGGYIIIGVEEQNGLPVLPPKGLQVNQIEPIQKKLLQLCHTLTPHYFPIFSHEVLDGKDIVVLWVPGGDHRPYKAPEALGKQQKSKAYYIRRFSSTKKANVQEEKQLFEMAAKVPFDDRINNLSDLTDLRLPLIRAYLKEVGSNLLNDLPKIPFEQLCRQLNIVKGPTENPKPVNIGLLMFNDQPHKFFRGAKIEVIQYKDEIGDKLIEKVFEGPIVSQLRNALQYIKGNVIEEFVKKVPNEAESIRFYNYPFNAVEEALANAVYHKSYEHQSAIEVNVRADKIEILSFPGPIPPVNNESLKQERVIARDYRNRRIGDFLKELHLTEGRATGLPKIRHSMRENGSGEPMFITDDMKAYFLAVLPVHPYFDRNQVPDLSPEAKKILTFSISPRSREEILQMLGESNNTHQYKKYIEPLLDDGFLEMTIPEKPRSSNQKYKTSQLGLWYVQD